MPDSLIQPILLAAGAAAALYIGLAFLEGYALPMPGVEPAPEAAPEPVAGRRPGRRRLVVAAAAVLLIAIGVSGVAFIGTYDPIQAAGPATGSGPLYLGTVPATYGGVDSVEFAAVSGGEVRFDFRLMNTGDFPLTIVGLGVPSTMFASGLLAPAGQASSGTPHRFQIGPHAIAAVSADLRVACIGRTPTPTLAPGKSPSAAAALAAAGYGLASFGNLPISYEAFGIQHQANIPLPFYISMAVVDRSSCDGQNAPVVPSGLYVTPVPSITYP